MGKSTVAKYLLTEKYLIDEFVNVELNKRLVIVNPAASNLDSQIRLEPLGGGRFRYVAPTGGGPIGEVVYFVEAPGKPMRMMVGDNWVDRVEK